MARDIAEELAVLELKLASAEMSALLWATRAKRFSTELKESEARLSEVGDYLRSQAPYDKVAASAVAMLEAREILNERTNHGEEEQD